MPSSSRISIKKLPLAAQHSRRQNGVILTHKLVCTALESTAAQHYHSQPQLYSLCTALIILASHASQRMALKAT